MRLFGKILAISMVLLMTLVLVSGCSDNNANSNIKTGTLQTTLYNGLDGNVSSLRIAVHDTNDWSENLIDKGVWAVGEPWEINLENQPIVDTGWDLEITFEGNDAPETLWEVVPLNGASAITITVDGTLINSVNQQVTEETLDNATDVTEQIAQ